MISSQADPRDEVPIPYPNIAWYVQRTMCMVLRVHTVRTRHRSTTDQVNSLVWRGGPPPCTADLGTPFQLCQHVAPETSQRPPAHPSAISTYRAHVVYGVKRDILEAAPHRMAHRSWNSIRSQSKKLIKLSRRTIYLVLRVRHARSQDGSGSKSGLRDLASACKFALGSNGRQERPFEFRSCSSM